MIILAVSGKKLNQKNIESLTDSIFGCIVSAMMEEGSSDGLRGRSIFDPLT